jgi:probable rRNA maturation factor
VVLVDDEQMSSLNWQYRKRRGTTNVLAFAMRQGEYSDISPQLLGDVVISVATARRQAQECALSLEEMVSRLLVHGILHLFGYDHEKDDLAAREMEQRSAEMLELLQSDPGEGSS